MRVAYSVNGMGELFPAIFAGAIVATVTIFAGATWVTTFLLVFRSCLVEC
jgi:hypothetical protein